jgi:16S rRNA processing protein RimM
LAVGQVSSAHGIRGEIRVHLLTDDPRRFDRLAHVWLGTADTDEPTPWPLESYRLHKGRALLKLRGCDDRSTAETLRGYLVQVPIEQAIPLEEGEFFEHQVIGLQVWTSAGEHLGHVEEIIYTGANEVYIIRSAHAGQADILIPAIEEVVLEIDPRAGRLVVDLIEGLI